jgi:outer membrane receptor protein involved in Fe transport
MTGLEFEIRQHMGEFLESLQGLSVGANATFIESQVTLAEEEQLDFQQPNILAPMTTREMTGAPDHLYNFYLTYDLQETGTQFSVFYTVNGDTLVAGAGESNGNFVPSVYAKEFDTLNLSVSQKLGDYFKLQFKAKNLTDPSIETFYGSQYIGENVTRSSFTKGIDLSISLSAQFTF